MTGSAMNTGFGSAGVSPALWSVAVAAPATRRPYRAGAQAWEYGARFKLVTFQNGFARTEEVRIEQEPFQQD